MNEQEQMLTHVLGCRRIDLYVNPPVLSFEKRNQYNDMCRRFIEGEPLQYILGECDFMGIPLKVNPSVLIPRPETEILVECVLGAVETHQKPEDWKILDLGTGSGNIAISLAKFLINSHITAVDVSSDAIALAKANAFIHGVFHRIDFVNRCIDDFLSVKERPLDQFDIIVSNPPYIRKADLNSLPKDVQQEPKIALDGGEDGLDFYRVIIGNGYYCLRPGGFLFLEIGDGQEQNIRELVDKQSIYHEISFHKDYTQTQRIISLRRK